MGSESYWDSDIETALTKEDVNDFSEYLKDIAAVVLEKMIDYSIVPGSVSRRLSSGRLQLEVSEDIDWLDEARDLVDSFNTQICISEVKELNQHDYYEYLLISHTVYVENGQLNYRLNHYLINEFDGACNEVKDLPDKTPGQLKKMKKAEKRALSDIKESEPVPSLERLQYLSKLIDKVVEEHVGSDAEDE